MNILNRNLTALGLVVIAAAPVMAQESTGMIRGAVRTKGGQPLAGATIELTSPQLMMKRTVVTNERGEYRAPLLPPGEYKIVASKGGFITVPVKGVHLGLGQTLNQEIVLPEEKAAAAVVEVVATAATQDKTDVKTGVTLSNDTLETLPGNARGLEQAAGLAPGVSTNSSGLLTIRGGTALDTKYLLNGTDISDNFWGQYDSRKYFVDDAVQETQVISSTVHAKFGGTSGGIVNAITKSGGNEFEGTLRLNMSSSSWTAQRPLGPWRPNEGDAQGNKRNLGSDVINRAWSLHVMGPIVKDRLWFSVSTKLDPPQGTNAYMSTPGTNLMDAYFGKDLTDWYGDYVNSVDLGANNGLGRAFYVGPNPGQPYTRTSNNQFYEFKLTGAINANHTLEASGSKNTFSQDRRLYGTSADMSCLGPQSQDDKYVSLRYRGILASNITLEAQAAKKFLTYGGGGDPAKGDRIRAKDQNGTAWQFNNATFSQANPDDRNIRTINANLSIWGVDLGKLGQHTIDVGAENITRNRRAANLQSPTGTTIYALGSWMNNGVQNFIMRRHDPRIDTGAFATEEEWLAAMQNDRDPNWDTMFLKEVGSNDPTETQIYSGYINDTITLNNNWQVMLGLRYDRTDVADTFGTPTIKNTAWSPRFQLTYDVLGNQRYIFRASWARYTGALSEGFTNRFSLAGNPISEYYTWKAGNDGENFTLADIQNRNNWDLSVDGLLWVDNSAAAVKADPNLKCPSNDEVSVGFRYNAQDGSYLNVTYAQRSLKNPYDSTMLATLANQVPGFAPSFPSYSVPMSMEYWSNSDMVRHDFKSLEVEWQSHINNAFQVAGNFTYSILKGNGNLDSSGDPAASTALGYYRDVQIAMGHSEDMFAPYGNLTDDSRFKGRVWGTYTVGTQGGASLSTTLMANYDGGMPFSLTRANTFNARAMATAAHCGNLGQYPTSYTRYYGGRGAMRTNDTFSFDLKMNLNIPIVKKVSFFTELTVFNVFNHVQLTGLDTSVEYTSFVPDGHARNAFYAKGITPVTAYNGGTNYYGFGTYGFGNYTTPRSVVVSTGLRW